MHAYHAHIAHFKCDYPFDVYIKSKMIPCEFYSGRWNDNSAERVFASPRTLRGIQSVQIDIKWICRRCDLLLVVLPRLPLASSSLRGRKLAKFIRFPGRASPFSPSFPRFVRCVSLFSARKAADWSCRQIRCSSPHLFIHFSSLSRARMHAHPRFAATSTPSASRMNGTLDTRALRSMPINRLPIYYCWIPFNSVNLLDCVRLVRPVILKSSIPFDSYWSSANRMISTRPCHIQFKFKAAFCRAARLTFFRQFAIFRWHIESGKYSGKRTSRRRIEKIFSFNAMDIHLMAYEWIVDG